MASFSTGGLLYHRHHRHQHHQPFHLARSRFPHPRRSTLSRLPFYRRRLGETLNKPETLSLTLSLRSVQYLRQEEQACLVHAEEEGGASLVPVEAQLERSDGGDAEAVDWVNSAARDPMVEVDPVTVFLRIAAERRASLAMAMAEKEAAHLVNTTSPPPFFPSSKRPSNSAIAIATALVLLAVAAAVHFFRSGKNGDAGSKLTLTDGNYALGPSINGRRKLVTIKASQSVLTAMKVGAASLGRPMGHSDPDHETSHAVYDNGAVEQTPKVEGETDLNPILNIAVTEGTKSDTNGSSSLQQMPSCVEDFTPFKGQNVGVDDVTEGPWFGQAADPIPAEKGTLEYEAVHVQSQGYQFANDTVTIQVVEQSVSKMPVSEVLTEPLALTASTLPVEPNHASSLRENPKSEETEGEVAQPSPSDSGINIEETEQIMEQDLIRMPDSENLADDVLNLNVMPKTHEAIMDGQCLDQGLETDQITINQFLSIDQASDQRLGLTPEIHQGQNEVLEGHSSSQKLVAGGKNEQLNDQSLTDSPTDKSGLGFADETEQDKFINSSFSVDQTVDIIIRLEQELGDILVSEDLTKNSLQVGQAKEGDVIEGQSFDQGLVGTTGEEQLTEHNVSSSQIDHQDPADLQSYGNIPVQPPPDVGNLFPALKADCPASSAVEEATDKVSERDSNKALEAAVPALAIGVGTVGTLLGVAGGLQVVGFVALASLISHEFLWAQSRDSLWQELSSITDRQKLLDFLAKRNIMKKK